MEKIPPNREVDLLKKHNARVLMVSSDHDIKRELQLINTEPPGIARMTPKARHFLVKLENVRRPVAHILKETFLSNGGDAAISKDMITATSDFSGVILMGTRRQYERAMPSLRSQGFGCDKLADEIIQAVSRYSGDIDFAETGKLSPRCVRLIEEMKTRTLVMGILNVTPDSFSDGGRYFSVDAALEHAEEMIKHGADIIDIGAESTRPGAESVAEEVETARIIPVVRELRKRMDTAISIDTTKAAVAQAALNAGADIINDISGACFDPDMPGLIAMSGCLAVLMHIKGSPRNMQENPVYDDLIGEIYGFLNARIESIIEVGGQYQHILIDPGFGFGKTPEHNLEILRRLAEFKSLGRPIMIGTSRKSTIGKILGNAPVDDRIEGTAATVAASIANGANIIRVHDVREMVKVAKVADAIVRY